MRKLSTDHSTTTVLPNALELAGECPIETALSPREAALVKASRMVKRSCNMNGCQWASVDELEDALQHYAEVEL